MENNASGYKKRPLWQWLAIYVVIGIVVYGLIYSLFNKNNQTQSSGTMNSQQKAQGGSAGEVTLQSPTVEYTANGFVPDTITVKPGTTVSFINKDTDPMWVASDPHPIHTDLPGFDAKRKIPTGDSYSYTFTKVGRWGYHNHLNPSNRGTVIVGQ